MKKIIINQENLKQRIDKFLVKELFSSGMTRGEIINNIKKGNIKINGKTVKPSYRLKINDVIEIKIKKEDAKPVANKKVKPEIIYSDANIVVINKPAGIQVHPVKSEKDTLINGVLAKFPEIKNINDGSESSELRPGIVHRLDRDTSGVMVIARNQKSFDELKKMFQIRKIKKEYLAVVFGNLENKKGIIEKPIARSKNYKKQVIAGTRTRTKIRPAVTEYEVLKEYADYSLVSVSPKTGRTHQIRVHLSALGHSVVGDDKYKLKKLKNHRKTTRQLLHAGKIKFSLLGKKYSFQVPLPKDFSDFLGGLTP